VVGGGGGGWREVWLLHGARRPGLAGSWLYVLPKSLHQESPPGPSLRPRGNLPSCKKAYCVSASLEFFRVLIEVWGRGEERRVGRGSVEGKERKRWI
jgi:hypothetical protein